LWRGRLLSGLLFDVDVRLIFVAWRLFVARLAFG
jgi:hypothetical protein